MSDKSTYLLVEIRTSNDMSDYFIQLLICLQTQFVLRHGCYIQTRMYTN